MDVVALPYWSVTVTGAVEPLPERVTAAVVFRPSDHTAARSVVPDAVGPKSVW